MTIQTFIRAAAACCAVLACSAQAHPHVWVTMHTEVLYAPDGSATAVRHSWAFDDMFSAFATQGYASKVKGQFTREELAPLAKVNVESLKEYDYFTYATADGLKAKMTDPAPGYYLDYTNQILTLHFTLPFEKPVRAKELRIEIYDPTIFVDFEFAKETPKDKPVKLVGAPSGCLLDVALPREMTYAEGKALSNLPADEANTTMLWGKMFANKILVHCP